MIVILSAIVYPVAALAWAYRGLRALQMNGYRMDFGSLRPNAKRIWAEHAILFVLATCASLAAALWTPWFGLGLASAVIAYAVFDFIDMRTHLKFTPRAIRLTIFSGSVLAGLALAVVLGIRDERIFTCFILALIFATRPLTVILNAAIRPFENLNNMRYVRRAQSRLGKLSAVRIGITGSYGKTSCKNILSDILATKYKVLKTDKNYNTPLGIARTAEHIQGDEEIFIAEMGARRPGDIKELCELVKPKYAIVTGIAPQHLATFRTVEKIYETKKELVDCLPPDGFAVFNGDNSYTRAMANACTVRCATVHTNGKEGIYADNIQLSNNGSCFCVHGLGEEFCLTTRLLGRHNILNILMCIALAAELGIEKERMIAAVRNLKPSPHRLELLGTQNNGVTVIDDSYNGNLEGVRFALEVLALYKENRRVVFTQGIVELGKRAAEINTLVGAMIAGVADLVLLTGENALYIKKGLNNSGFPPENILIYKDFSEASESLKNVLRRNDVLLIQNDIP
jgi:UDP-N-acetylmuramoyl-tripeptide--D-alanyl-D-alanine ligase